MELKNEGGLKAFFGDIVDFTKAGTVNAEIIISNIHALTACLSSNFTRALSEEDLELALREGLKFMVPLGTEDHTWMLTWGRAAPWLFQSSAKSTIELIGFEMTESVTMRNFRKLIDPNGNGEPESVSEAAINAFLGGADAGEPVPNPSPSPKAKSGAKSEAKGKAKAQAKVRAKARARPPQRLGSLLVTERVPMGGGKFRKLYALDIVFEVINSALDGSINSSDDRIRADAKTKKGQLVSQALDLENIKCL